MCVQCLYRRTRMDRECVFPGATSQSTEAHKAPDEEEEGRSMVLSFPWCLLVFLSPQVTAVNAVEDEELKEVNAKEVNELENRLKAAGVPFEP